MFLQNQNKKLILKTTYPNKFFIKKLFYLENYFTQIFFYFKKKNLSNFLDFIKY